MLAKVPLGGYNKTIMKIRELVKNSAPFIKLSGLLKQEAKRFISLELTASRLKIAYLEKTELGFKLINYALQDISALSKEEIVGSINNFLKTNNISEKEVILSLSFPDDVIIKSITLPVVPKEEIAKAVKWHLKEDLPFDLKDATFDWQIVKEFRDDEEIKKYEIVFVVARLETINRYLSLINECGLLPLRIGAIPFNYTNILKRLQKNLPLAILDIAEKQTNLCIYKDAKLSFIRELGFSSSKLTQSLVGKFKWDKGELDISFQGAENLKEEFGILADENAILEGGIPAVQFISLLRPHLEILTRDLKQSFSYFASSLKEDSPATLYITGEGAGLKNLDNYLNKELNIPVVKFPIPETINTTLILVRQLTKDYNQLTSVLGGILEGSAAIDLLPSEIKIKKIEFLEKISLRLISIVLGAIFLTSSLFVNLQIQDYKSRLKNSKVHLQTISEVKAWKEKIGAIEALIGKIEAERVPVPSLLKLISSLTPSDVALKELILDQGKNTLFLKGIVSGNTDIAEALLIKFTQKIEASSFCSEATLVSFAKADKFQEFEIKCDLVH